MRLNKFIAESGVCSRRAADKLISAGRVQINNKVVMNLGVLVEPITERVKVDGKEIKPHEKIVTYILNKPRGIITTVEDPEKRKTVLDFVPAEPRVFPCGRLDEDTMGLVVLTNDGTLCYQLTHPKFEHQKEYIVEGNSKDPFASLEILKQKVVILKDGPAKIDLLNLIKQSKKKLIFGITIHEGRNHLVRRICAKAGIEIEKLTRIRVGKYSLGDLAPGEYRIANV